MNVLLSIVTIVRNDGPGLAKTFQSMQSLLRDPTVELLIVDGASTDDTAHLLAEIRSKTEYQIVVCSEPDCGIYDAMNKGLRMATGRHVIFMNAGDRFATTFQLALSDLDDATIYYGDAEFVSATERFVKRYIMDAPWRFLSHNTFCHQAIVYPTKLLRRLKGYDLRYKVSADFDLTLRCYLRAPFLRIDSVVCVCELGGFSGVNGWQSYRDRMHSVRTNRGMLWSVVLFIYAPVFYAKHQAVKALVGSKLLSWYRSVRYG